MGYGVDSTRSTWTRWRNGVRRVKGSADASANGIDARGRAGRREPPKSCSWPSPRFSRPRPFRKPTTWDCASSARTTCRSSKAKRPESAASTGARFHLIGHLQSNKATKAAELFQVVQTVDSAKLARRLNDAGTPLDVMLEVKLSEEEAKSGADPGAKCRR